MWCVSRHSSGTYIIGHFNPSFRIIDLVAHTTYVHTYIIGHYNLSVKIIDLVSHTTYVVCVNFIYKSRHLKSTPNDRFFEKLFMAVLIYSQSFCLKSAARESSKKYFLYFVLILAWGSNPGFTSHKPTHYPLRRLRKVGTTNKETSHCHWVVKKLV